MRWQTGIPFFAALSTAFAVGLVVYRISPPPRSLGSRVRPYLTPTPVPVDHRQGGAFWSVFGPMLHHLAGIVDRLVNRSARETILLRLRQAGWSQDSDEDSVLSAYRIAQLKSVAVGLISGLGLATVLDLSGVLKLLMAVLGLIIGATRKRGLVEKAIEQRRQLMRIEIYTVNQLLAMRVRAGGGVVHAVQATVERGTGQVIEELAQALRLHRAGWRAADAFRRVAELTPEPFCSRTYRLMASAEERGTDLAGALLALSEDVRESRREGIKRSATKRRAAMLVPTIAILAPVLILFVAAPLPYLITGWQ